MRFYLSRRDLRILFYKVGTDYKLPRVKEEDVIHFLFKKYIGLFQSLLSFHELYLLLFFYGQRPVIKDSWKLIVNYDPSFANINIS